VWRGGKEKGFGEKEFPPHQMVRRLRADKAYKNWNIFSGRPQKFFSNKETIFAGFVFLLTQGRVASYPHRTFVAETVG
jgi:hypothetical protein